MTDCVPNARQKFRVGQLVCRSDDETKFGLVVGFTLHPGGLVVLADAEDGRQRVTFSHMDSWRPA